MQEEIIHIHEGELIIDGNTVEIGGLIFAKEISRGANGIVYKAYDSILERQVAFKIWAKLRAKDFRDKKKQALLESRKLWKAKEAAHEWTDPKIENPYFVSDKNDIWNISDDIVGHIYYAGYINDYFYIVMEYIDGITLKAFLQKEEVPFGVKYNIARTLNQYHDVFLSHGIVHGDFHSKNVMVLDYHQATGHAKYIRPQYEYKLKVIDFGTSFYSKKEDQSIERSFKTLIESIDSCIAPFKLDKIKASEKPTDYKDAKAMSLWINQQLLALRAAFFKEGAEFVGWPYYRKFGTYELTTEGLGIDITAIRQQIRQVSASGKIQMTEEFLAESKDWDSFEGRTAKRGD